MRVAVGVALASLFIGGLVLATLRESRVACEVCLDFGGERACRTASAADRDQAVRMARSTACADLAGGVTETMQCMRVPSRSERCEE